MEYDGKGELGDPASTEVEAETVDSTRQEITAQPSRGWNERMKIALAWQVVSVLLTGTAVFSQLLADQGVNLPTTQSFINYVVLGLIYGGIMLRRGRRPREVWWKYFAIAVADVEGNFLLVLAYQYTTITSVQLLDCFTIPVVIILSRQFLGVRYSWMHLGGAGLALAGLALLVTADAIMGTKDSGDESASNPILGDILVMIGSTLYGISNVGQEYMVKERDRIEFLAHLGVFGAIISGIQMGILEHEGIKDLFLRGDPVLFAYMLGFGLSLLGMYIFVPILLERSSATFMNLSLLTADFYSLVVALVLFHAKPSFLYFIAFCIIVGGLIIYNLAGDAPASRLSQRPSNFKSKSEEEMSAAINGGVPHSSNGDDEAKSVQDELPQVGV